MTESHAHCVHRDDYKAVFDHLLRAQQANRLLAQRCAELEDHLKSLYDVINVDKKLA